MIVTQIGTSRAVPSSGYIVEMFLIEASSVTAVLDPNQNGTAYLDVPRGVTTYQLPLRPKNCTYSETEKDTNDGLHYVVSITASFYADNNANILDFVTKNRWRRWVVVFRTSNGGYIVAGDEQHGLRLFRTLSSGERSMIVLTLTGIIPHPLWRLDTIEFLSLFSES